jgi:heat shock protein HslJ
MRMSQKWRCRVTPLLLSALVLVALISSASTQAQGALMQDLLGTEWLLEDLAGSGVIDNARATLSFPESGKVTGNGSCDSFFASVVVAGDRVSFDKIGSTFMQCTDPVSDQEGRYLAALESADRMSVDGDYLFVHSKSLEKSLRFTRLQKP